MIKTIEKTIKLKLIPLTRNDKNQVLSLLDTYTSMIREALDIIVKNDVRSRKKAHELCYRVLRGGESTHIYITSLFRKHTREHWQRTVATGSY